MSKKQERAKKREQARKLAPHLSHTPSREIATVYEWLEKRFFDWDGKRWIKLETIPADRYPFDLPPETVVIEHWQTPAFCRQALRKKDAGGGQIARYKAIAKRCDWGVVKIGDKKTARNWALVWLEPPGDENGERLPVERGV